MTDDNEITDLNTERIIRKGAEAWQHMIASDPELRASTTRYMAAKTKLRPGMLAMLEHYSEKHDAEAANTGDISKEIDEDCRIVAKNQLLEEIDELSEIGFWVLSEALELIITDERMWKKSTK